MKSHKEFLKEYENHIQNVDPIFKDVKQDEFTVEFSYTKDGVIINVDTDCFNLNGYEFAKRFINDSEFHHMFENTYFTYDYYNHTVFMGEDEIYSGIDFLNAIKNDFSTYNQIEDLATNFFGGDFEHVTVEEFLSVMSKFNEEFNNAIDSLDDFINDNLSTLSKFC